MAVLSIPVESIKPDPSQPRKKFNQEKIKHLSRSITEVGLLQPIIVRPAKEEEDVFYLVAGERRLQGAKQAGEETIMASILEDSEVSIRQMQLVENLQREDLNPLEKARSVKDYMEEESFNKSKVSAKLGIPRTTVTEWLNILEVSTFYQDEVVKNFEDNSSPLTLSHISLAKALDQKTGDISKKEEFLDAVLAHELSREEARRVVHLFDRYYNITVEEAVAAIRLYSSSDLLKRKANQIGKEKGKMELPEDLKEMLALVEDLIERVDRLLGEGGDYEEVSSSFVERLVLLHCFIDRFLRDSMKVNTPKKREEQREDL